MNLILVEDKDRRRFGEADFPLPLGLTPSGRLSVGAAAEAAPAAWLRLDHGRFSIQPERARTRVAYDGAALTGPAWLVDACEITIGKTVIDVGSDGEDLMLTPRCTTAVVPAATPEATEPADDGEQVHRFGRKFATAPGDGADRRRRLFTPLRMLASFFALLALGVAYVLITSPVQLHITPTPDSAGLSGFPPPIPVGDNYLALPGSYRVTAQAQGYRDLDERVTVDFNAGVAFAFTMRKLPGKLSVTTPPIEGAAISVDGEAKAQSPAWDIAAEAGKREIRVTSDRYLPELRKIEIKGMGEAQSLEIPLRPGWGTLMVTTEPPGARVAVNGKDMGATPLTLEPMQGMHRIVFSRDGWKPVTRKVEITAGTRLSIPPVRMEKIDGTLALTSAPAGATILVAGQFRGRTPASFPLVSGQVYEVKLSKPGYVTATREVPVEGAKTSPLAVKMQPEYGTVFITTTPPGAKMRINGMETGGATQRLRLQTLAQTIEVRKQGYLPFRTTITPSADVARRLMVRLRTVGQDLKEKDAKGIRTTAGQRMRLILIERPIRFTMGAPRREPGRRSNEAQYPVDLTRSFLVSEKEITNAEFRKFRRGHSSGSYRGDSLNGASQPVVKVSWEDAARYANWLSKREGLQQAYREDGVKVVPVRPIPNGYRLPSEAEWEFISRLEGGKRAASDPLRFLWGAAMPPVANSGNYADDGARRLPFAIPGYRDGQPVSAPVGKYRPNGAGLFDLGGNVAEWCHDYYDVAVASSTRVQRDPAGPSQGRFHVIKGSSWRSGGISELRLSYRDYAEKPRDDVGFRIARYVDVRTK